MTRVDLIHAAVDVDDCGDEGMVVTFRGEHVVEAVARHLHPSDWDGLREALADKAGNLTTWTAWVHRSADAHALAIALRHSGLGLPATNAAVQLQRGPSLEKECEECRGCGRVWEPGWAS